MTLEKKIKDMSPEERRELNKRYMQQYISKKSKEEIEEMKAKAKAKYAERKKTNGNITKEEKTNFTKEEVKEINAEFQRRFLIFFLTRNGMKF